MCVPSRVERGIKLEASIIQPKLDGMGKWSLLHRCDSAVEETRVDVSAKSNLSIVPFGAKVQKVDDRHTINVS